MIDGLIRDWRARRKKAIAASPLNPLNEPRSMGLLVDCGDLRFVVDPRDMFVGQALRNDGIYEPGELERLGRFVRPGGDVLFVGTHIGALAIPVSRLCRRIAMVEANPDTFRLLEANCLLNKVGNADLYPYAAGEAEGSIGFVKNTHNSGGSKRVPKERRDMYYYDDPKTVQVPMRRLDDLLDGRSFDLAVMDIEGSEIFALRGMPDLLSRIGTLVIEFVPHHLSSVAGITVAEFLAPIMAQFDRVTSTAIDRSAEGEAIEGLLDEMYAAGQTDGGLIFERGAAAEV